MPRRASEPGERSLPAPAWRHRRTGMRIATYWWGGRRHVGRLSDDATRITALACERARELGALALIEDLADGRALPRTTGASLPLSAVRLDAPIPVPRRNIFC